MGEFALSAMAVRERNGDTIQWVVIDAKTINHVDITGCEMLGMLAEVLHKQNKSLIVANLKGHVLRCLDRAGVPEVVKKNGHLCDSMSGFLELIEGHDPRKASEDMHKLLGRVLRHQMKSSWCVKTSSVNFKQDE